MPALDPAHDPAPPAPGRHRVGVQMCFGRVGRAAFAPFVTPASPAGR